MDRFFLWLRRLNSVLFLPVLIGVGIAAYLILDSYYAYSHRGSAPGAGIYGGSPDGDSEPVVLSFGEATAIAETSTLLVNLVSEKSSSRRRDEIRNVLFLSDGGTRQLWLFESHQNRIHQIEEVSDADGAITAIYVEAAPTEKGARNVYLAKPDGSAVTEVLNGVTRVLLHAVEDDQAFTILYQKGDTLSRTRFDLASFAKTTDSALLEVPQEP